VAGRKEVQDRPSFSSFVKRVFIEFQRNQCLVRASGLAFASLIALVPLSALLFSLFSSLGSFSDLLDNLQRFLIRQLVPASQEEIMVYVRRFVENTRALGVVGLLFFLLTSIFLLATIQNNFNAVWGSRARGKSLGRLVTYASILIVGSFVVSIGLNLTGALRSVAVSLSLPDIEKTAPFLLGIFPSLFIFLALLLMIRFIPSGAVHTSSALLAAAVGAVCWEIARRIFFLWVTYVIRLSIMYGSLAAIPIFLVWLYVAWTIVLASLEIAYVHQHWRKVGFARRWEQMNPAEAVLFGLEVYLAIAGRFLRGEAPPTCTDLSRELPAAEPDVKRLVDKFCSEQLVLATGKNQSALVPSRSLDAIPVRDLLQSLIGSLGPSAGAFPKAPADDPATKARSLLGPVLDAALSLPGDQTVADLLRSAHRPDQAEDGARRRGHEAGPGERTRDRLAGWWRRLWRRP
jgi:membrane protein